MSSETEKRTEKRTSCRLRFRRLRGGYAIGRLAPGAVLPEWAMRGEFTSITRTAEETSVVCPSGNIPDDVQCQRGWACLKLEGPLPFSQTGILLSFIEPLSSNGVPIFAISTYDTDYVLIQEGFVERALDCLRQAGHEFCREDGQRTNNAEGKFGSD
jgi:uncharacterized protein